MELQGSCLIPASPTAVWAALNDAEVLQRCIPGCEEVVDISDSERSARVAVKLGPVRARFNGKLHLRDVLPAQSCTLAFEGSGGAAGFARGQSQVTLVAQGEGTQLAYTVSASVGGKLGQVGGRMIDSAARGMADEFFAALSREWAAPAAPAASPPDGDAGVDDAAPGPAPAGAVARSARQTTVASTGGDERPSREALRIIWFALGAAATALGVLVARWPG